MNFTRRLFFIVLTVAAFSGCYDGHVHVENQRWTREVTSLSEDPFLADALGNFKRKKESGRIENVFGDLNLEEVAKVSNDSLTRYSLLFNSTEDRTFANLILTETEGGSFAHIVQYVPDTQWYDEQGYDEENWDAYTGMIIYYDLDGIEFARSCLADGVSEACNLPGDGGRAQDVRYECETTYRHWSVCIGSDCSYHMEVIDHQCTGQFFGGGGYNSPADPWFEDPRGCVYNDVGDCEPRTPPTPVSKPKTCTRGFLLINGDCVKPEEAWEEGVCQKTGFAANSCLQKVWNKMRATDTGYTTLKAFLSKSPTANLCLDASAMGANLQNGSTSTVGETINITLNSDRLNRSQLSIARTILHELIHAELYRKVKSLGGSHISANDFPGIYDYIRRFDKNWQHQQMAGHYVEVIANGLARFDGNQNSRELYEALAWVGLWKFPDKNTSDPNDLVESAAWATLTTNQQTAIKNLIANHQQNENKTCQ